MKTMEWVSDYSLVKVHKYSDVQKQHSLQHYLICDL